MELILFSSLVLGLLFLSYGMAYLTFSRGKGRGYSKGLIKGYEDGYNIGFDDGSLYQKKKVKHEEKIRLEELMEKHKIVYIDPLMSSFIDEFGTKSADPLKVTQPKVKKIVKKKES